MKTLAAYVLAPMLPAGGVIDALTWLFRVATSELVS